LKEVKVIKVSVIYLQTLIKSNEASDALSTMSVLPSAASTQLDIVEIIGPATVGFLTRSTTPALNAQVGKIIGNADSLVRIDQYVDLYWGTRVGIVDTLRINTNVHVQHNGKIDLPKTVFIDKGWSLDVCGIISSNTNEMTVREDGALKISHPAADLQINTLVIDYQGKLEGSDYCDTTLNKVTLKLTYFNTTSGFSLDTTRFSLSASKTGTVSATASPLSQDRCPTTANLILNRTQSCTMPTGSNTYTSITINTGAELKINGSKTGSDTTVINANNINVKFGGVITGVGTGYESGGAGAASSGQGATHGGRGVGNTKATYGSIQSPMTYGSNGNGATSSSGRGGGQLKLVVSNTLTVEGTIDMSADSGNGGSGGSLFVTAKTIEGDGYMKAEGSSGGGGGRIAAIASSTYSYTGTLSALGGETGGNKGSPGNAQFLFNI
jgi:hypothetical protein